MEEGKIQFSKTGVLYKFRSWSNENHKNALLKGEFFLTSPKEFNDPWDCQVFIDYSTLDTPEKRIGFANKIWTRDLEHWTKSGYKSEQAKAHLLDSMKDIERFQEGSNQLSTHIYQTYYGVLCLANSWKPILLWSHYADYHRGYCVGLREYALIDLAKSNVIGRGGLVHYDENYPKIRPDIDWFELALIQSTFKAKCWEYEEEYRLVKAFYPNIPSDEDRKVNLEDGIVEVTLGAMIPENDKQEIIEIAKGKNIKVYQAKKVPFKFEIGREEIL